LRCSLLQETGPGFRYGCEATAIQSIKDTAQS
jgi:hypothetical protein